MPSNSHQHSCSFVQCIVVCLFDCLCSHSNTVTTTSNTNSRINKISIIIVIKIITNTIIIITSSTSPITSYQSYPIPITSITSTPTLWILRQEGISWLFVSCVLVMCVRFASLHPYIGNISWEDGPNMSSDTIIAQHAIHDKQRYVHNMILNNTNPNDTARHHHI